MPGPIEATGAVRNPTRYGALTMGARQMTGLDTQRSPYRDAQVPYLVSKFYSGSRFDSIIDGINREITQRLTDKRRPGSVVYNSQSFPPVTSFYSWKYIQNNQEIVRLMLDTAETVYDGTGPSTKLEVWNKNAGSGATRFLGINTELFFNDGIEPKKWVESALTWAANTLYDGAATSDTTLGDYIIDPNGNIQQAVGGFTLIIADVAIADDVLTLTLDTSQLADPTGTPTGTAVTSGGNLPAGNNFMRVAGVDPIGNTTEAGNESAAVVTSGATSKINWTWPAISGAVSYRIYVSNTSGGEATYFTSSTNSFTQTVATSTVSGTPPVSNSTSVDVPNNLYGMIGVELALSGLTTATFLNGETITIASVLNGGMYSNQITASFTHGDYDQASDTGTAVSGSGITGSTQPSWATTLWAVTQDGGAQWINRGSMIENWGIATPAAAPSVYLAPAPTMYGVWTPNTTFWLSGFMYVVDSGLAYMFQLTTAGTTGGSAPTFDRSSIGATTADGSAVWTYQGPAQWTATTAYSKGAYVAFGDQYVYQAQNAGISGASQSGWATGAGALVEDGSILWKCLGVIFYYDDTSGDSEAMPQFTPNRKLSLANTIVDSNGYLQQVQDPGGLYPNLDGPYVSGSSTPTWEASGAATDETLTAAISAYVTNGSGTQAALTAPNAFRGTINGYPDLSVTITGMVAGTFLNGTWTLASSILTPQPPAGFAVSGSFPASEGPTDDEGTATQLESGAWLNIGAYAPVGTAGTFYVYSYGNSVTAHVGSASGASPLIKSVAGFLPVIGGFGSADPQVDTIWIFRPAQGEATPVLVDKIRNPGGAIAWTYTDAIPDVSLTGGPQLNALILAPIDDVNDPPPLNITAPVYHLQRPWGIVDNTVVYGGGPDTLVGSGNEAFPPENEVPYPAQPIFLVPVTVQNGGLLVYTTDGIYIILGTGTADNPFYTTIYFSTVSVRGVNAFDVYNQQVCVMESNGKVSMQAIEYPFNPQTGYTEIGFPIGDQFLQVTTGGIDEDLYDPANAYVSWNIANSADTGLYVADGAVGWFRMSIINPPESGFLWSPRAAIAGGTSAVQNAEISSGTFALLMGPATEGPILMRDQSGTAWDDDGTPYPAWDAKGVNLLCSTGQWADVAHVSTKSAAVGARPAVSVLLGEIAPSEERPYSVLKLDAKSNDPATTRRSVSVFSDRYVLAQNGVDSTGDCLLTKFDYGSQAEPDELLDWAIFASVQEEREAQAEATR